MDVTERFLKYVSFDTESSESSATTPSTEKQKLLGEYLVKELKEMGIENSYMDENGYVYGFIPASEGFENAPKIGLIAHMDTAPAVSGKDVKPKKIVYTGGDIPLSEKVSIKLSDFPILEEYKGEELIITDGSTLLGADDKAGIAEIFSAAEYILKNTEIKHGAISIGITPDEEIGRGADKFDVEGFSADYAYTIDGGELGEIEYENFNGASVRILVNGINIHPGSAKNKMKNASLMLTKLISMLPENETPATTEGYEGFYHVCDISGNESLAEVNIIIRDHDREKFERRKEFIEKLVSYMNSVCGEGTFVLNMADSYYNMKEKILPHMHIIDAAKKAMIENGVEPKVVAIRGGTDGARLSFMGLPCPNLSTGGINFHSIHEFIPVRSMEKMRDVIISLVKRD